MQKVTEPGKWYFAVNCAACQSPIPLAEAPSPNEMPDPLRYRIMPSVSCPHCGHIGIYAPAQISRRPVY
jgi:endogenous inhibitor of DNA gyrase (YacG/DUF329 family)